MTKDQNSQIQDQEEVSDVEQSKATTLNSSDDQNIQNNDADSEYGEEEYNIDDVDLDTGDSAVAATSTSKVISIIVVSLAVVVFLYGFYDRGSCSNSLVPSVFPRPTVDYFSPVCL